MVKSLRRLLARHVGQSAADPFRSEDDEDDDMFVTPAPTPSASTPCRRDLWSQVMGQMPPYILELERPVPPFVKLEY